MTNSVQKDKEGPDWPLGSIVVATPGTPVGIMSVVDSSSADDPGTTTGANLAGPGTPGQEFTVRAQQIIFQAFKAGASHGLANNTGNIYIVRKGVGSGTGNRDDTGSIVMCLTPGQTYTLTSAALNRDVFSPYRYSIDADNANDACQVTLILQ